MNWLERYRVPIIVLLVILILSGGALFFYRRAGVSRPLEITLAPPKEITVYVGGEVAQPGIYALARGDRVEDLIDQAGGFTTYADQDIVDLDQELKNGDCIYIYAISEAPQKININTAEAWLLEALPEIGPTLAQRIIDYRSESGFFEDIEELKEVEGIGQATYGEVKDYITVQ